MRFVDVKVPRRPVAVAWCAVVTFAVASASAQPEAQPETTAPEPEPAPPAAEPAPPAAADAPAAAPPPPAAPAEVAAEPPPPPAEPAAPAAAAPASGPSAGPLRIETPLGSVKLGVLLQPQYEALGSPTLDDVSHNLFIRRTRVLVGVTLFENFELFFETDYPDLFKSAPDGVKNTPGLNIQDAMMTAKIAGDQLKVDVGYMLPPLSHNALQGATSLYGWDYFGNTFRHGTVFNSSANPAGRDTGLELRGLLVDGLLEYRVGAFQGRRVEASMTEAASRNFFRVAGRVQLNLLDPETAFFYAGSYLGAKRILSVGASYDFQDSYKHPSFDVFADLPVGPGVFTAQANVGYWDGDDWVDLPEQTALMAEAGYLFSSVLLSPILRFEQRWVSDETAAAPDETRFGGGLAWWPHGHNINLKAFYTRINPDPAPEGYDQFNVQAQFYVF